MRGFNYICYKYLFLLVHIHRTRLSNLTQGIYNINDNFHKENLVRLQDVHNLQLEVADAKNDIAALSNLVSALLTQTTNSSMASQVMSIAQGLNGLGTSGSGVSCTGMNLCYRLHFYLFYMQNILHTVIANYIV